MKTQVYFFLVVRLTLGAIFLVSGVWKIPNAMEFAHNVAGYQMLPHWANITVAAALPWIEAFCGILLIAGYRIRACSFFTTVLMLFFMVAMASAVFRGLEIDCGCFQPGKSLTPTPLWVSILRDMGFLVLSLLTLWKHRRGEDTTAEG